MKLTDALRRAAHLHPDAIATVGPGRRKTFRQIESRVSCLANALIGLGLAHGDVVAIAAAHSDRVLEAQYAIAWAGGIAAHADPRLAFDGLCALINDSQATILVLDDLHAAQAEALLDHCEYVRAMVFCGTGPCPDLAKVQEALIIAADPMPDRDIGGDATAALCYRRTDDGRWLASELSHHGLCFASLALAAEGGFTDNGRGLQATLATAAENLAFTGSLLLRGSAQLFIDADSSIGAAIHDHGVTDLLLPAPALQNLLAEAPASTPCPGLGQILITRSTLDLQFGPGLGGAAPALAARYPTARLMTCWGTPELCGIATAQPLSAVAAAGAVGRPIAYLELRVAADDGRETARGGFGELYARGPTTLRRYWQQPDASAVVRQNDWVACGIRAAVTADGGLLIDPSPVAVEA